MTNPIALKRLVFLFLAVFIFAAISGCDLRGKEAKGDKRVVARINNYDLTIKDFSDEARFMIAPDYLAANPEKANNEALEGLITKKVLLQEAQKQNFDKDKAFMREIERYWEQALIKLLINKKIEEFSKVVITSDDDVKRAYDQLTAEGKITGKTFEEVAPQIRNEIAQGEMRADLAKWVRDARKAAKIKIYEENLKAAQIK